MENLQNSFYELMDSFQVKNEESLRVWRLIEKSYNEKGRFYHNLNHISDLIDLINLNQNQIQDLATIKFTAFFHDIVYKTTQINPNNEKKSAEKTEKILLKIDINTEIIQKTKNYILATQHHKATDDQDLQYFLDMDLSILGAEPKKYVMYAQQIRQEYQLFPDFIYKQGRKKVLENLLNRNCIFKILKDLENNAHKNIKWELDNL